MTTKTEQTLKKRNAILEKELAAKNRELEIEMALEKVRARTMAMQHSDELAETSFVLFQQFKELGKTSDQISIGIFKEDENVIELYSTLHGSKWKEAVKVDLSEPVVMKKILAAWKKNKHSLVIDLEGDLLKKYNTYREKLSSLKFKEKRWVIQAAFFSKGVITFSSTEPHPKETIQLLERFATVFDGTYTRFLDLQKAEAQAREAQIEAALEKVRSCSLAMHKSDELRDVVKVVFEKLQELDFAIDGAAFIGTLIENSQDINIWIGDKNAEYPSCFRTPVYDAPSVMDILKAKESGADFFSRTYSFEEKNKWFEYAFQHTDYKTLPDQLKSWVLEQPFLTQSFAWAKNSGVGIHFHHQTILSDNEIDILKRFSKVFEQGYVRFLDLQKAEAQAREAMIEAALEKIRSRSLAMQKSDELKDVIAVVFEKLKELGLVFDGAGIQLFRHVSRDSVLWVSSEISEPSLINLPYIEKANENSEFINTLWMARKTGNDIYNRTYSFDEKNKYFNYVISNNPQIPASIRELMLQSPSYTLTMIMKKNSAIIADSFSGKTLLPEEYKILGRVASVFEQVYVRFLDLQKAEAQAREAQIELALERVRAKTMAMQKSDELKEVIQLVYEQFVHLNIYIEHTGFLMDYKERDDLHIWLADQHLVPSEVTIPWFDSPPNNSIKEAKEKGQDFFKYLLTFEEKNKFYRDLFKFIPGVPEETLKYYLNCPGLAGSGVLLENIGLYIENFEGTPYTDEENDTLMRLGKVFQQTYTRFLDLEKAEAQARESQIQLALERVRARTMAMQKSDELSETVYVLFQQFKELGEKPDQATIGVINEDEKLIEYWVTMYGKPINKVFKFSIDEPNVTNKIYKAWKENKKSLMIDLSGDALTEFMAYRAEKGGAAINRDEKRRVINVAFFSKGLLNVQSNEERSEESIKLLERFASVFEQTYTRFLDLQKAEAQAREAQIELGLERVRARAMAMQTSEELNALIGIVFTELTKLDLVLTRCVIIIYDAETKGAQWWMANSEAPSAPMNFFVKYANLPFFNMYLKGWEERDLKWQYILGGENKIITDNFLFNKTELKTLPDFVIEGMKVPHKVYLNASFNNFGNLTLATLEPLSEKHFDILLRFAKVFDLTYTRFNDLQKAEAQAREAQIQLALERVRARTMAMQKQNDLLGVLDLLVEQLLKLGVNLQVANFSNGLPEEDWDLWIEVVADANNIFNNYVHFPRIDHPYFRQVEKNIETYRKDGTELFKDCFSKEEKDSWQDYIHTQTIYKDLTSEEIKQSMYEKPGYVWSMVILKDTWVTICRFNTIPFSDVEDGLLRRFANAFGQAYTRFLDLQKAEAQAREAKIEAALEKVRSRSMAMFKSEELSDVITVVSDQLQLLNLRFDHVSFVINSGAENYHFWTALYGKPHPYELKVPYLDNPIANEAIKARSHGIKFFQDTLTPEENRLWLEHAFGNNPVDFFTPEEKAYATGKGFARSIALMPNIMLVVGNYASRPYSDEDNDIIKRFASVFEQSYTRFLDLKKAEEQAREAQIEASLERVRGKAMSMHSSRDLADTIEVFYHEIELLSITPRRCGVGLMDKETHFAELSTMNTTERGESIEIIGKLKMAGHPVLEGVYDNWVLQKEYHPVLRGDEIKEYYKLIRPQIAYPDYPTDMIQYGYFFFFNEGGVYAWTEKELSEDELKIYRRFTSVLSLTYKRYKDLKDAEANTKEAIKQASLDRVRAETASMRTTGDLEKITPLIWNELTTLRVPFIRCGVFIMDEQQKQIHSFLSTPDGKAIAAFQLPYQSAGELSKVLAHWHKNEIFKDHWDEATFVEWTKSLVNQGAIASEEQYSTAHRPANLDLNFLPFLQGMLYVGCEAPLSEEEIHLVQSLADAFSTAYARYEDFNKLEAAKKQVDSTLNELQATQKQLVQSEKMASLGELTAGIAHEIQNPLNFVNNFSEVSNELIDEMNIELDKGDIEEAKKIASDLKQNLEKINHHGKRAGDIVKGMLQHSRSSTGQKEPTDINALADEYLRLSYHGLRAKDKTFNAKMETDFDNSIGKINIIPQDIGRVLLNLFNNAFYACTERSRASTSPAGQTYEPTVTVRSFLNAPMEGREAVNITVSDNGNGIPKNIVDKIFQPFFTTKPTGQGTGLGLSLSYDIVTTHGGELKVKTEEGKGSEFIIQLPLNK